jgi:hypothetical protein
MKQLILKKRTWWPLILFAIVVFAYPSLCASQQQDVDIDLNRRVIYKLGDLKQSREVIAISKRLEIQPKIEVVFEKFDRFDVPRTKQWVFILEKMINPSYSPAIQTDVITSGFIRCDLKFPAGTDSYFVRRLTREWAEYIGESGFECFVYFVGWVGRLKVSGYEYDPIELKVTSFR